MIGFFEAAEINRKIAEKSVVRPLTHDLLRIAIEQLGAKLTGIEICALRENTFFANLVLDHGGETLRIDCRPSDAIALAVAQKAPIAVEEAVIATTVSSGKPDLPA